MKIEETPYNLYEDPHFYMITILEVISILTLIHLWRQRFVSIKRKLIWTIIILIPLVGPLAYGGLFEPPPPTNLNKEMGKFTNSGTMMQ